MTLNKFNRDPVPCEPTEVELKSFFLGPQAENGTWLLRAINDVVLRWFAWRRGIYPHDGQAISAGDQNIPEFKKRQGEFHSALAKLCLMFENEMPKFSPRYVGHMFSEISLPALLGHLVTLLHNPNNISTESSRVGVVIEEEAINALVQMIGYDVKAARGHFTSGGTIANFEAMVRARARLQKWLATMARKNAEAKSLTLFEAAHCGWESYFESVAYGEDIADLELLTTNPYDLAHHLESAFKTPYRGPVILVSKSRHYSWDKGANVLGHGQEALWGVELDRFGRLSIKHLDTAIEKACREQRPILMVTSVAGSTERGSVDAVHEVQALLDQWRQRGIHIWHHVDAAYGGFFQTISRSQNVLPAGVHSALNAVSLANSLSLDPHKLGYVPYASGAFLCRTKLEYSLSAIEAPYINFHSGVDRGPLTLEGSRSAGGAAATWMTARCIGFKPQGYGKILERTIRAANRLEVFLKEADPRIRVLPHRDSNIVCFCVASDNEPTSQVNAKTLAIYDSFSPAHNGRFIVSKTNLKQTTYKDFLDEFVACWNGTQDTDGLAVIRLCMMNPFHDSQELNTDLTVEFVNMLTSFIRTSYGAQEKPYEK